MVHTRSDASANRLRLITAARDLFAERGMDAEMKEIAERAGVGIGTIYRNFATKDDLVEAVLDEVVQGFYRATDHAIENPDPVDAVRQYIRETSGVVQAHGGMVRSMLSGNVPPCAGSLVEGLMADTRMRSVIQRGIDSGVFHASIDPVIAASTLLGLADPVVIMTAENERTPEQVREGLTELLLRSLRA